MKIYQATGKNYWHERAWYYFIINSEKESTKVSSLSRIIEKSILPYDGDTLLWQENESTQNQSQD
jgi:hypothetical protein